MNDKAMSLICEYCASHNPSGGQRCIACGAPLPMPRFISPKVSLVGSSASLPPVNLQSQGEQPLGNILKEGAAAVGSGLGLLGIGTLILRTVTEAVAIAVSAYIIGMYAGSADITIRGPALYFLIALGGGGLLGLCVGLVTKRALFTLFSAPIGTILGGVLLPKLLLLNTPISPWPALFALTGGILFALLGGHRSSYKTFSCYQRVRPFLGFFGGIIFGLLGFLVSHRIY